MIDSKFDMLMKDEEFLKTLLEKDTMEEAKLVFEENGVQLTTEELTALSVVLYQIVFSTAGEVTDSQLAGVSGGKGVEYNSSSAWNGVLNRFCTVVPEVKNGKLTGKGHWYPSLIKIGETAVKVAGIAASIFSLREIYKGGNATGSDKALGWIGVGASAISAMV